MLKKLIYTALLIGLSQSLFCQVKLEMGMAYNYYLTTDSLNNTSSISLYMGALAKLNKNFAVQVGLKAIFHKGIVYNPMGMFQPIGAENYLALSLLLPINVMYHIPQSRWAIAAGPAVGYHDFKRWGTTTPYLKDNYNYSKIRLQKEFACTGYQAAVYFKKTDVFNIFAEYAYSKSSQRTLSSLSMGFRYRI